MGIWVRPSEVDPVVLQGLGGGRPLLHKNISTQTTPMTATTSSPPSSSYSSDARRNQSSEIQLPNSSGIGESGARHVRHPSQTGDFEIFLDNYLRSFDLLASNGGNINNGDGDYNQGHLQNAMHLHSSDDFMHGALTGDWASVSKMTNDEVSPAPATVSFGITGSSAADNGRNQQSFVAGISALPSRLGYNDNHALLAQTRELEDMTSWSKASSVPVHQAPLNGGNGTPSFEDYLSGPSIFVGQSTSSIETSAGAMGSHLSQSNRPGVYSQWVSNPANSAAPTISPSNPGFNTIRPNGTSDMNTSDTMVEFRSMEAMPTMNINGGRNLPPVSSSDPRMSDAQAAWQWDDFWKNFRSDGSDQPN